MLVALGAMVVALAAIAVWAPPNTWDAMTYHMARVAHWMQNASLENYPTHEPRQLYLQPGAEIAILHLQLLSGGDHFAALVQWASMVGALVGTSLIAHGFGAKRLGQLGASIFAASLPIGILQSTSTQDDYVVAFWLVCAAVFGLRITRTSSSAPMGWTLAAAFGASSGLALLTKATAYLFLLPIGVWVAVHVLRTQRLRAIGPLALAAALALALNVGFYARSRTIFAAADDGNPNVYYTYYWNDALSPSLLASNIIRDLGVNLIATPLLPLNQATERASTTLHGWLGVDPADPRTTWLSETFSARAVGLAFDENFASNPAHLVLLVGALGMVWLQRRRLPAALGWYALALTVGFGLFSAVLRWQPWHSRLELPLFVLGAPVVGVVVERLVPRLSVPLSVVLLASMLPWIVYNQARPLIGPRSIVWVSREAQYFTNQPWLRPSYLGAVEFLSARGCGRIGVLLGDWWEYPLWALLWEAAPGPVDVEDVVVDNATAALPGGPGAAFQPCALLAADQPANPQPIDFRGRRYAARWQLDTVTVLLPDGS